jgi:DNA-binding transcriptional regulator of glucitol operon
VSPIGIALLTWKIVVFAALVLAWWVRRRLNRAVTGLHQQLRAIYGEAEAAERLQLVESQVVV